MSEYTHKMVNGDRVELTSEEIAEFVARDAAYTEPSAPPAPTKQELLAQLNTLAIKIEALG